MSFSVVPRVALLAAAAIVATFSLTGCAAALLFVPHSATGSGTSGGSSSLGAPTAGECWSSSYATAQQAADWEESGPIACASTHQLYTFAVATVRSSAGSWSDSDGNLDGTIAQNAFDACNDEFSNVFTSDPGLRLQEYFFVPTVPQWRAGARWVRCDVGLVEIGSSFSSPRFAPLPVFSTLIQQTHENPSSFDECVTTTDSSGALGPHDDPDAVFADCTADYQWKFASYFTVPGGDSDPYPSDGDLQSVGQSQCGDDADAASIDWITYVPTTTQWEAGDRSGECWVGSSTVPET